MGTTIIPNGSGGVMIMPTVDAKPQSHTGHYMAGNGVHVQVEYKTDNSQLADQMETELLDNMGWKVAQDPADTPLGKLEAIGLIWLAGVILALVIPAVVILVSAGAHAADWGSYAQYDTWLKWTVRAVAVGVPLLTTVLSVAVMLTKPSQN